MWFGIFRLGVWPNLYPNVQFSHDTAALNQFFRQSIPNTGPYDVAANVAAISALFDKIGPGGGVLVTHSQSGTLGWRTAIRSSRIRAIVSYEPGGDFVFPEGEAPAAPFGSRTFTPPTIPLPDFMQLTKIPIIVYYGDNIPEQPTTNPAQEQWRAFRAVARAWRDAVNRRGGDVTLVELPSIGIRGNTHFPMSDLNNVTIADLLSEFLHQKGLD
jgi:pimeloyl-ACP methyl ester carboxylesterase